MAHYLALQVVANGNEALKELAAKLSLALLRHTDIVPADKAFYLAGMACNVRWLGKAGLPGRSTLAYPLVVGGPGRGLGEHGLCVPEPLP